MDEAIKLSAGVLAGIVLVAAVMGLVSRLLYSWEHRNDRRQHHE